MLDLFMLFVVVVVVGRLTCPSRPARRTRREVQQDAHGMTGSYVLVLVTLVVVYALAAVSLVCASRAALGGREVA